VAEAAGRHEGQPDGAAALLPERVLFAVALLQALQADQQQQKQPQQEGVTAERPPLQAAIHSWLDGCAAEQRQPGWRRQRLLHLALLLAEAGLLCPAAYLTTCLASGAFQGAAATAAKETAGSRDSSSSRSLHIEVLEQLHPLLEYPTLAGSSMSSGANPGGRPASAPGGGSQGAWAVDRVRYGTTRATVLRQYSAAEPGAAATASTPAAEEAVGEAREEQDGIDWEQLLQAPSGSRFNSETGDGGSTSSGGDAGRQEQQQRQWRDRWQHAGLQRFQQQLLAQLGLNPSNADAASGTNGAAAPAPGQLLQQVSELEAWQQRHTATVVLAAAKAFLSSTDSGSSGRPSPPAGGVASGPPGQGWLVRLLAVLRACGGHREVLSLLATSLNVLQRAVAAAVRAATGSGSSSSQAQQLGEVLSTAQQQWQQRSGVAPPLLLALLSAHAASLAASDIAAKLLPMLTGGLWRLQQPQHQQQARQCLAGQLELAAELLTLPNSSPQQWLDKMEQQHGSSHGVVALLQQQAAACKSCSSGSSAGEQPAELQAFLQRAQQLPLARGGDSQLRAQPGRLLQDPAALGAAGDDADVAAALTAIQHSLSAAALPAVLQQLGGSQAPGLQEQLLGLGAAASQALLSDPQQAYTALHQKQQITAAPGTAAVGPPWQLAVALFASSAGAGGDPSSLLGLSSSEAMAAAMAATTPATARWGWMLLRLLLDEQQWQGGHRLAEAERQLAARCAAAPPACCHQLLYSNMALRAFMVHQAFHTPLLTHPFPHTCTPFLSALWHLQGGAGSGAAPRSRGSPGRNPVQPEPLSGGRPAAAAGSGEHAAGRRLLLLVARLCVANASSHCPEP
jgi:hypothetical protein